MEEMRGQLDLEPDRPTKRLHHDYDMQDEDMTHGSRNNKRNIRQMNGQLEPESDYGSMSADSDDDGMREEAIMHSPPNNKRNIGEMNGQLEIESDRAAKRVDHGHGVTWDSNVDDVMQDEGMTHSPPNKKRNIEEMSGQIEPESDRAAKRQDHGDGVTWARNVDDVMQDEDMMHSPPNKKRNIEEMSGQIEPDLDRAAKRQDHGDGVTWARNVDDVMQDEDMMHSPPNKKRNIEEMSGQIEPESDRPAKRLNHDHVMQEEAIVHSPPNNKRNIDEMNGQLETDSDYGSMLADSDDDGMRDEAQPIHGLRDQISVYAERVRLYSLLQRFSLCDENLCNILNEAYSSDRTTFAKIIHDSPQHVRLWALERLDAKFRREIINLMSDMEREKENNDPIRAFPTIMTDSLAREPFSKPRTCVVCGDGFCSANKKNRADVEDVVWKDCGVHLMHLECFRRKVLEGEMPLKGLCGCIEKFARSNKKL
ncbi:uncharacterized protein FTOL_09231 [Fusarium torulosum]|uniref:Uncharacterized protein n=1 Tax=Fusarium torulosum TaxID=33205 RepID=A0AAE8ME46_9HYPO|nr:uncharacterized protein FTOL_09231 [Fusarium torulosum]